MRRRTPARAVTLRKRPTSDMMLCRYRFSIWHEPPHATTLLRVPSVQIYDCQPEGSGFAKFR